MENNKPVAFNYADHRKAIERNEELESVNSELKNEIIRQRIIIDELERQLKELRDNGPTITRLLEVIRSKMCDSCINNEECSEALERGEEYSCIMDLI